MAGNPDEEVPEVADETSRLAILDLDWTKVIIQWLFLHVWYNIPYQSRIKFSKIV